MALDQAVKAICDALDGLANAVYEGKKDDQALIDKGWNYPALTRHELSAVAANLSERIEQACTGQVLSQAFRDSLTGVEEQLKNLQKKTVPQLYSNGNDLQAYPAYLGTLFAIEQLVSPVLKPRWEEFENPDLMPKNLATRVRSIRSLLDEMDAQVPELQEKLRLIIDAHAAAVSLPADTALLQEIRTKIAALGSQSEKDANSIAICKKQSVADMGHVTEHLKEANGLIAQLRELHRVGTSTTLAGAFQKRADALSKSVWAWLTILVLALISGVCIGLSRIETVTIAMNASIVQWSAVWINVLLTMLSVSAPVWLGWVATKQIAQRFRLAEDYAYKASISNARCLISCANKGKSPHRAGFSCPWGEAFANKALGNVLHCT